MKQVTSGWMVKRTFLEYVDDEPESKPQAPRRRCLTDSVLLSPRDEDVGADEADVEGRRSSLLTGRASCPAAPLSAVLPAAMSGGQGHSEAELPASDASGGHLEAPRDQAPASLGAGEPLMSGPSAFGSPPTAPPPLPVRPPWPVPPAASALAPASWATLPWAAAPGTQPRPPQRTCDYEYEFGATGEGGALANPPPGSWHRPSATTACPSHRSSNARSAGDERTTVMLRNIPKELTRTKLLSLLDKEGFWGRYDFVYLPVVFSSGVAVGHIFINMVSPKDAQMFWDAFEGFSLWPVPNGHPEACVVEWSPTHQGLSALVKRYRDSPVMHPQVPDEWKPILLSQGRRLHFPSARQALKAPKIGVAHGGEDAR